MGHLGARRPRLDRASADLAQGGFWMLAGLLALALVWWAQHVEGMAPCELCYWERWPYRALLVLGVAWGSLAGRPAARVCGLLVVVSLCAAICVAGLHVGVEQGWWPSPLPECAAPVFHGGSMAERLASMPLRPAKPCDAPNRLFAWLPVSMATLDLIYAVLLLLGGRIVLARLLHVPRRTP